MGTYPNMNINQLLIQVSLNFANKNNPSDVLFYQGTSPGSTMPGAG